ncbi:MAG TPA: MFS transporter [Saprospiraceae bacterium]|nr:MFS transporter [Saprospiraceae bacterium]
MRRIITIIVLSQLFCCTVWFGGNAVLPEILAEGSFHPGILAHMTSSVQFGFITGTLLFALLMISDRYPSTAVFLICSFLAGSSNLYMILDPLTETGLLASRFATGFFLAGIYPVGMKIASDHFQKGLGLSLGFLVGALVLGTASPHLIREFGSSLDWNLVVILTSLLCATGGLLMWFFVPEGPHRKPAQEFAWTSFLTGFKKLEFRSAAFGYFGHMWELYSFWAFLPFMLEYFKQRHQLTEMPVSCYSFLVIGAGGPACVAGAWLAKKYGTKTMAAGFLLLSGCCCLFSPIILTQSSTLLLLSFLLFWGMVVVADSPLFSTLIAQEAPETLRGSSLTIVNCIGFSITIISLQCIQVLISFIDLNFLFAFLSIGPALGLLGLIKKKQESKRTFAEIS